MAGIRRAGVQQISGGAARAAAGAGAPAAPGVPCSSQAPGRKGAHSRASSSRCHTSVALRSANEIAEEMVSTISGDLGSGGDALLFVNGFGGTPLMELYVMYNAAATQLAKHGIRPVRSLVGSYVTSLDMAGCSITVSILDEDAAKYWDAPVHTPALRWGL